MKRNIKNVDEIIANDNYCQTNSDCVATQSCVLGCNKAINLSNAKIIINNHKAVSAIYNKNNCKLKDWMCELYPVECLNNKCVTIKRQCLETAECESLYCNAIIDSYSSADEPILKIAENNNMTSVCPSNQNERSTSCICSITINDAPNY